MNEIASTPELQHSFYASALTEADRPLFEQARGITGLDEEIALLRLRVRKVLANREEDAKLIESGVRLLIQSLLAQRRLSEDEAEHLSNSLANLLEGFGDAMRSAIDV